MKKLISLSLLFLFVAASAKDVTQRVLRTKVNNAPVYKLESSESGEASVTQLPAGEEVTLKKQGKARTMILTKGGIKGWIDNTAVEWVNIASNSKHNLKDVEVVGWLDNPSAVYILDNSNPDLAALPLDRSFKDEIVEIKDREQVERGNDEN